MNTPTNGTHYTSRLIKASALLSDTKMLLGAWDLNASIAENLARAQQINIFGKASRSRVEDILVIFRQRYFDDPELGRALAILVQAGVPSRWLDPLFYYYSVQNDVTLRAIVLEVIGARRTAGQTTVNTEQVTRAIDRWIADGKTTSAWSEETITRVARHALAALRDFGLLTGAVNKSISPLYLPIESFAFLAFDLQRHLISGEKVLHSPEWQLFFLTVDGVERFFVEAHQEHMLSYQAAGPVVRLEFPANTLEAYAHVLVQRVGAFERAG